VFFLLKEKIFSEAYALFRSFRDQEVPFAAGDGINSVRRRRTLASIPVSLKTWEKDTVSVYYCLRLYDSIPL
jgi:hypothetical protein